MFYETASQSIAYMMAFFGFSSGLCKSSLGRLSASSCQPPEGLLEPHLCLPRTVSLSLTPLQLPSHRLSLHRATMSDRPPAPSSLLKLLQQPRLARLSSSYASNRPAIQKVLTASLLVWVLGITCKGVLFPGKKKGDVVVGRQPKGGRRSRAGKGPRVEVCPLVLSPPSSSHQQTPGC
jgi:hypothetical protein